MGGGGSGKPILQRKIIGEIFPVGKLEKTG
jgi:hypothetical protein